MALGRPEPANPTTQDLGEVVSALGSVLHRLVDESIELTIEAAPDILIEADRSQLEQIVLNLVVNARDAIEPHGTIVVRVLETSGETGKLATIEVEDDGCGISPEDRNRLFEPFFTTKAPGQGTGLGLATVYMIVERLGGTISVESELDVGTKVGVHLPVTDRASATRAKRTAGAGVGQSRRRSCPARGGPAAADECPRPGAARSGRAEVTAAQPTESRRSRAPWTTSTSSCRTSSCPAWAVRPCSRRSGAFDPTSRPYFMTGYADKKSTGGSRDVDVLTKPFPPDALVRAIRHAIARADCARAEPHALGRPTGRPTCWPGWPVAGPLSRGNTATTSKSRHPEVGMCRSHRPVSWPRFGTRRSCGPSPSSLRC